MALTFQQKVERAVREVMFYNGCADYVESPEERLPASKQGYDARQKALSEGRVKTYKQSLVQQE